MQKAILDKVQKTSADEVSKAMVEAAKAIDTLTAEKLSLRRANVGLYDMVQQLKKIIISERAQLIYYTQKALDFMHRKDVSVTLTNFADLSQEQQEEFVKRAVVEVGSDSPIIPHEELKVAEEKANPKKVRLN